MTDKVLIPSMEGTLGEVVYPIFVYKSVKRHNFSNQSSAVSNKYILYYFILGSRTLTNFNIYKKFQWTTNIEEKLGQQNTFRVAISFLLGCSVYYILNIGIIFKCIKLITIQIKSTISL